MVAEKTLPLGRVVFVVGGQSTQADLLEPVDNSLAEMVSSAEVVHWKIDRVAGHSGVLGEMTGCSGRVVDGLLGDEAWALASSEDIPP